jgi:hypothetical protein
VKESSIPGAGLGLFATKNIKAGTIISFYPVHTIGVDLGHTIRKVSIDLFGNTHEHAQDKEGDTEGNGATLNQAYLHHVMGSRPLITINIGQDLGGESLFVDVDVDREESPGFHSHRINDGATVTVNSEDGVLGYYQKSRKAKNCVHVPFGPSPLLATVATKKIPKGSELFTTYGCSYWISSLLENKEGAEETPITEPIVLEAKAVAMDVMQWMNTVASTYSKEAEDLHAIFLSSYKERI